MEKYIGLDVHAASCTAAIMDGRGKRLGAHVIATLAGGTKPNLAKVTLARKLAAITLAMWKTKEAYDPKKKTSTAS